MMFAASRIVAVIAVICALISASPAPEPKPKDADVELKKLGGTWEVERCTLGGREFPKGDPPVRYEFRGSIQTVVNTKAVKIITLNLSTNPKRITLTDAEIRDGIPVPKEGEITLSPNGKGSVSHVYRGEYVLDGDKLTLTSCWGKTSQFPPTPGAPKADDPVHLMVLKRVKK
jgi:uncharacterized protein (TIGR03067 family)